MTNSEPDAEIRTHPPADAFEAQTDSVRRKAFLRYVVRGWLGIGILTLLTIPLFPTQRTQFLFVLVLTLPTYLIVWLLNRSGRTRLAGAVFSLVVNFGFYGLFLVLVNEQGALQAFNTQATVWMLMGLAILFAGAFVDKWAAPALAVFDALLLIGTRLILAPHADPRPSVLVFWAMLAVTIWFYERTVSRALSRVGTELAERRKAEKELEHHAQNTATMYQLSQQILTNLNLDQVYDNARQAVQTMMPCDAFVISLMDEPMHEIEDVFLWDGDRAWPRQRRPAGQGLANYVISTGKPWLVNHWDDAQKQRSGASRFGYTERASQSILCVPLLQTSGKCVGMLSAQSYQPGAYLPEHEQLLVTLANQLAEAIEYARLFNDLRRSNAELSQAYDSTIEGWSRAMDLRDKETEGHTQRVTELTLRMAHSLGFQEEDMVHIRRGGLLHDIGKLGVPDDILLKHEDLTEQEWVTMRRHPAYAYEMLSSIAHLEPALEIPYCHHEKWDGTGYPRGLKGEQIPLAARVFAVADVWDALTSDRPYRPAWTRQHAVEYIQQQSGKHFDPQVVEPFLRLIAEQDLHS